MQRTGRRLLIVVALFLVIATATALYLNRSDAEVPQYTIAQVERGDIVKTVLATGQLVPRVAVEISSQISGLVTEVKADFNIEVKKGQILALIDPTTYAKRLQQAKADLSAARANYDLLTLKHKRQTALRQRNVITQAEYEEIESQFRQAEARLMTLRAAIDTARIDLERCTIKAPIDGIVIYRQIEVGKTIVSSFSAPTLFVIAQDLARMRIIAPISEVDIWSVRPGQEATFTIDALPGRIFHGVLTQIRNPYTPTERLQQQASAQGSGITSFDAVIDVDNQDLTLRPSLTASISLIIEKREHVLKIPSTALNFKLPPREDGEKPNQPQQGQGPLQARGAPQARAPTVYLLANGDRNAEPKPVIVGSGLTDGSATEILTGLNEGDTVITGTATVYEPPKRSLFKP